MRRQKIRVALIASGSGTDAYAIMKAKANIPEMKVKLLISTKKGAGCLEKAAECKVPAITLDRKDLRAMFNQQLASILAKEKIQLLFLVGCVVKIPALKNVVVYNIHPADIERCGGKGMYGLEPHKKVLADIKDLVTRGRRQINDLFYTEPTIHEVNQEYDSGQYLLKLRLQIPLDITYSYLTGVDDLESAASKLQQHVLPYEWLMLPTAVQIAVKQLAK
ncbi:hypothetical protein CVU83_01450 [Candidatus Falkowbacteria bacterium HGW-Falkowbacteria-2]|uniref:phosphoribosylglycinamide formyltransferase 1 n=1 Tax=Candidatus Falkowbacteria bacterium HGW-Falkowbacteria-2 TaxID=2013769 RepID=A0A2N2E1Q8_9BACT|nr:MAG: hypothetical protein CVU83_01450 [Candidatus Falkowbacteria bacterium HGW-Falkowbacteria-2]